MDGLTARQKHSGSKKLLHGWEEGILVEKRGQLFSHTNNPPYTGFHVNPRWITNFLQSGKITCEVARKDALI